MEEIHFLVTNKLGFDDWGGCKPIAQVETFWKTAIEKLGQKGSISVELSSTIVQLLIEILVDDFKTLDTEEQNFDYGQESKLSTWFRMFGLSDLSIKRDIFFN